MSDRKVFHESVTPLPESQGVTPNGLIVNAMAPDHRKEKMTMVFTFAPPAATEAELRERVANAEVPPPEQVQTDSAPDAEDREALISWLQQQGFETSQVAEESPSVYARGSVDQIEKSLEVSMTRVTRDGITYYAAQNAPSLPGAVGKGVDQILGLQPFRHAHKHSRKCVPASGNRESLADSLSPNLLNAPPYLVSEVLKAYEADALPVTGKGQTIAILIDTFPDDADLAGFWRRNNLPVDLPRIEKINVKSGPLPPREGEETLDVEWASGIAPDARIRVYAAGSLSFVDLDRALERIIADLPSHPGMRQLSISLGLGETFMAMGEVKTQQRKFMRLAAAGVNVFVSSGDGGSNPSASGHSSTGPTQAEYESSDTSVIGVGGTTLTLTAGGGVAGESGWPGSGGGKSILFPRPPWQTGPGVPAGTQRLVPDVSLAADPNQGAFVVFQGRGVQFGGTSWSAPVWAGFCALMNESRERAAKPFLPFLNPLFYPLSGSASFRDIDHGSNGAFGAGKGYDLVTGIGVPNVKELIRVLTQ